jgi:DNA-binding CsgD family transcriptional regulator
MRTLQLPGLEALERPRLGVDAVRGLAKLGTVIRWPGLLIAGAVGVLQPPRYTIPLIILFIWVTLYNTWAMISIPRLDARDILRVGRALTVIDTVSYFALLAIFSGVTAANPPIYAFYVLLIVWMVAYDGAEGAMLSLALFVIGVIALQGVRVAFFHLAFNGMEVLLWSLIMAFAAAGIAAFDRVVLGAELSDATAGSAPSGTAPVNGSGPGGPTNEVSLVAHAGPKPDAEVKLSRREQEVLRLVSEGYSNAMIANRLHLSENTIKTYVETLLSRLHARNRAEAVAAASRQNLL